MGKYTDDEIRAMKKITCKIAADYLETDAATEDALDKLAFLTDDERSRVIQSAAELHVLPEIKNLHPMLQKHKMRFHAWANAHPRDPYANWNRDTYRSKPKDEPPLWECVSEDTLPRVYRILDPLYRAIENLGGRVNDVFPL